MPGLPPANAGLATGQRRALQNAKTSLKDVYRLCALPDPCGCAARIVDPSLSICTGKAPISQVDA